MNVHGVGHRSVRFDLLDEMRSKERDPSEINELTGRPDTAVNVASSEEEQDSRVPDAPVPSAAQDEGPRGVVRLLLAGHFKGVADVRLRINFYDELAAAESAAVAPVAQAGAETLTEAVDAKLDELVASGELSEDQVAAVGELREAFHAAVGTLAEGAPNPGGAAAFTAGVQSEFDSLMASLRALLVEDETAAADGPDEATDVPAPETDPAPEEPPPAEAAETEPVTAPDPAAEQTPDLEALLDAVADAFAAALGELEGSLAGASVLPELSPPNGNGVAYAKFLAIYNELRGAVESPDAPADETVDVVA